MVETDDFETLQEAYRLWNDSKADSVTHWTNLVADDVQWRSIADGVRGMEFSRACGCKDDVARYFSELAKEWGMIHYTVDEFICEGERFVMLGRCGWKNRRTGKAVETPKADIIRMRNGKIVEFFEFYDTAQAIAAAR